jgi:hypothetical protein
MHRHLSEYCNNSEPRTVESHYFHGITLVSGDNISDVHRILIKLILENGLIQGSSLRLSNIVYTVREPEVEFSEHFNNYLSLVGHSYFNRANLLFESSDNLSWKTNYKSKLEMDDQYANMVKIFSRYPRSSSICGTFLLPKDLSRARVIQATVPCPLSLTLNLVQDKISMNVFFRSQDILNLSIWDMYFLSKLQIKFVADTTSAIRTRYKDRNKATYLRGPMTFFVSSGFIRRKDKALAVRLIGHGTHTIEEIEGKK